MFWYRFYTGLLYFSIQFNNNIIFKIKKSCFFCSIFHSHNLHFHIEWNQTMKRWKKNPPLKVRTGSNKQVGGISMPQTTFGLPRTFLTSPSLGHHMLSSTVAETKRPATSKKKSVLTTVSPGMKQRMSPGLIDNGFGYGCGFKLPDDISDLDGLAKIIQPNNITSSASSVFFDHHLSSPSISTLISHPYATSNSSSSNSLTTTHPTKRCNCYLPPKGSGPR
jgi:hypothetical protein